MFDICMAEDYAKETKHLHRQEIKNVCRSKHLTPSKIGNREVVGQQIEEALLLLLLLFFVNNIFVWFMIKMNYDALPRMNVKGSLII